MSEKLAASQISYDPASYWDAKARRAHGDAVRAVCMDDPLENACIDRIQKRLIPPLIRPTVLTGTRPGDRVLDFGCGTGRWVNVLTEAGYKYSGVDISSEVVALGRQVHPEANLQAFDGLHLAEPDGAFALVLSIGVIHHNRYRDQDSIISELVRVTRPGGYLVLFEGIGPHAPEGVVEYPRPLANWQQNLESLGLRPIYTRKARYWIVRSLYYDFAERRLAKAGLKSSRWPALALRCDALIDPYILRFLPWWYVTRALMVYRKPA